MGGGENRSTLCYALTEGKNNPKISCIYISGGLKNVFILYANVVGYERSHFFVLLLTDGSDILILAHLIGSAAAERNA